MAGVRRLLVAACLAVADLSRCRGLNILAFRCTRLSCLAARPGGAPFRDTADVDRGGDVRAAVSRDFESAPVVHRHNDLPTGTILRAAMASRRLSGWRYWERRLGDLHWTSRP